MKKYRLYATAPIEESREDSEIELRCTLLKGNPHFTVTGDDITFKTSLRDYGFTLCMVMQVNNPVFKFTKWPWWNIIRRIQQRRIKKLIEKEYNATIPQHGV